MIINLKTAKMLRITLEASSAARRAGIEELTNYDYPDVRLLAPNGPTGPA